MTRLINGKWNEEFLNWNSKDFEKNRNDLIGDRKIKSKKYVEYNYMNIVVIFFYNNVFLSKLK